MDEDHTEITDIEIQRYQPKGKKQPARKRRWNTKPRIVPNQSVEKNTAVTASNARPTHWSSTEIFYLISAYKYIAQQEVKGKTCLDPSELWSDISKKLSSHNFHHTPEQCRTKWILLSKLYHSIQHKYQIDKFEFFDPLHAFYKDSRIEELNQQFQPQNHKIVNGNISSRSQCDRNLEEDVAEAAALETITVDDDAKTLSEAENTIHEGSNDVSDGEPLYEVVDTNTDTANRVAFFLKDDDAINESGYRLPELSSDDVPEYIRKLNEIVELQEQKREARHQAKMAKFTEFCEQLLAQREETMQLYRQMMERLIEKL